MHVQKQAIHLNIGSKQFDDWMTHLQKKDESKGGELKQTAWLGKQGNHQRLVASLAADESDQFSTDTEQRVSNAILLTLYGPVGRRETPPAMDMAMRREMLRRRSPGMQLCVADLPIHNEVIGTVCHSHLLENRANIGSCLFPD